MISRWLPLRRLLLLAHLGGLFLPAPAHSALAPQFAQLLEPMQYADIRNFCTVLDSGRTGFTFATHSIRTSLSRHVPFADQIRKQDTTSARREIDEKLL